ncbi:hydroxymethylglutaryl-CoA reductase [Thelonectria olida]|uniref:hydroxymethylglutaryl-CoA reductase (NADPH) n=1 Tax=Thelonectria olida TaxID=1576542 RepID=A0A9P8VUA2_9HYPO|nr:hydroxymethylglutaryl-CoA reductase [Thelonectria olida]
MAASLQPSKADVLRSLAQSFRAAGDLQQEKINSVRIENCVGFCKVPLGVAGPLRLAGPVYSGEVYAPLATYEATLVASCSRGCKAFNESGGIHIEVLDNHMSRGPVFVFDNPGNAVKFYKALPSLRDAFAQWAEQTSKHIRLQTMKPAVIGSQVHVFCSYNCGSAAGQNMVTKATQNACDMLRQSYGGMYHIRGFLIEGQLASDKKPSWGNVKTARGVEVLVWGTISAAACQNVLGCSPELLYNAQKTLKEGGIRNGQFGSNINTANVIAAMFIATGQDPASTAEASWSHLTADLDPITRALSMSLYLPSLPVGTVGGGTGYGTQNKALEMLQCNGDGGGQKERLAGLIAAFCLALDTSTLAAIANDTFTASHMRLARGEKLEKLEKSAKL